MGFVGNLFKPKQVRPDIYTPDQLRTPGANALETALINQAFGFAGAGNPAAQIAESTLKSQGGSVLSVEPTGDGNYRVNTLDNGRRSTWTLDSQGKVIDSQNSQGITIPAIEAWFATRNAPQTQQTDTSRTFTTPTLQNPLVRPELTRNETLADTELERIVSGGYQPGTLDQEFRDLLLAQDEINRREDTRAAEAGRQRYIAEGIGPGGAREEAIGRDFRERQQNQRLATNELTLSLARELEARRQAERDRIERGISTASDIGGQRFGQSLSARQQEFGEVSEAQRRVLADRAARLAEFQSASELVRGQPSEVVPRTYAPSTFSDIASLAGAAAGFGFNPVRRGGARRGSFGDAEAFGAAAARGGARGRGTRLKKQGAFGSIDFRRNPLLY